MPIILIGSNWINHYNNEFVTVISIWQGETPDKYERVFYQDNMGVKGSLPTAIFLSTFWRCESD